MEIISETLYSATVRTSDKLWDFFRSYGITFGTRGPRDLPIMEIPKDTVVEEYACFVNGGSLLTNMGAGSYQMGGEPVGNVGRYCSIADHVSVMGERHPIEHVTTSSLPYDVGSTRPNFWMMRRDLLSGRSDVILPTIRTGPLPLIGNDVWIGNGALLQRGIILGHGCIVGARSVLTKDVPPYAIVGGSPAKLIRMRFSENIVDRLLALKWWNLHPRVLFDFDIRSPETFLDALEPSKSKIPSFEPRTVTWETIRSGVC